VRVGGVPPLSDYYVAGSRKAKKKVCFFVFMTKEVCFFILCNLQQGHGPGLSWGLPVYTRRLSWVYTGNPKKKEKRRA
jgi:hypothetical protein